MRIYHNVLILTKLNLLALHSLPQLTFLQVKVSNLHVMLVSHGTLGHGCDTMIL